MARLINESIMVHINSSGEIMKGIVASQAFKRHFKIRALDYRRQAKKKES